MSAVLGTCRGKARFHGDGFGRVTVRGGVLVCNQCGHEHKSGDELRFYYHPQKKQGPWVCIGECFDKQVDNVTEFRMAVEAVRRLGGSVDDDRDERGSLYTGIFAGDNS